MKVSTLPVGLSSTVHCQIPRGTQHRTIMLILKLFISETLPVTPLFPCSLFICLLFSYHRHVLPTSNSAQRYTAVSHTPCCNLLPPGFVPGIWIEKSDTCKRMATHRISFPGYQLPHKDSQEWRMDSSGRGKREVANVQHYNVSFLNSLENSDGPIAKM